MKIIMILVSMFLLTGILSTERVLLFEDFEKATFPPDGWFSINGLNDEEEIWFLGSTDEGYHTNSGNGVAVSESECSGDTGCKYPDNWLITEKIMLPPDAKELQLTFYVAALHPEVEKCEEYYDILISTEGFPLSNFYEEFGERLDTDSAGWGIRNIDLTEYIGFEYIYIAFRHHDSTGYSALMIDDIKLVADPGVSEKDIIGEPQTAVSISNYPNPFNPATTVEFRIENSELRIDHSHVSINIYNVKGQRIRSLVDGVYPTGVHNVVWNGMDDNGLSMSSGVYFYQIITNGYIATKKMIMLK